MSTVQLRGGLYDGIQHIDWAASGYPDTPLSMRYGAEDVIYVLSTSTPPGGVDAVYDAYAEDQHGPPPLPDNQVGLPLPPDSLRPPE